jgi:hypothetical protein
MSDCGQSAHEESFAETAATPSATDAPRVYIRFAAPPSPIQALGRVADKGDHNEKNHPSLALRRADVGRHPHRTRRRRLRELSRHHRRRTPNDDDGARGRSGRAAGRAGRLGDHQRRRPDDRHAENLQGHRGDALVLRLHSRLQARRRLGATRSIGCRRGGARPRRPGRAAAAHRCADGQGARPRAADDRSRAEGRSGARRRAQRGGREAPGEVSRSSPGLGGSRHRVGPPPSTGIARSRSDPINSANVSDVDMQSAAAPAGAHVPQGDDRRRCAAGAVLFGWRLAAANRRGMQTRRGGATPPAPPWRST